MKDSRLRTVVSVAEIVSARAVVATLFYAVSELKRSRAMTSTDIETVLHERMLEMDRLVVEVDGFADVLVRAREAAESLGASERARHLAYEHIFFDAWEAAVEARKSGLMNLETFQSWDDYFATDAARRPRFAWTENLRFYNGDFVDHVEERVNW